MSESTAKRRQGNQMLLSLVMLGLSYSSIVSAAGVPGGGENERKLQQGQQNSPQMNLLRKQVHSDLDLLVANEANTHVNQLTAPIGQNVTYSRANMTNSVDLESYLDKYIKDIGSTINQNTMALEAHVRTDKVIYKPGDYMYIEVYVVDAFTKAPFTDQGQAFPKNPRYPYSNPYQVYASMQVLDPMDQSVYSTSSSSINSTISFTFPIPDNQAGGLYKIVVQGSGMADAIRVVRIREYQVQELVIQAQFNQESYQPGDLATGAISVTTQDGSQFQSLPTYSYIVSFGQNQTIQNPMTQVNEKGQSSFSVQIPVNTTLTAATVAFTFRYLQMIVPYTLQLSIAQSSSIVVDFFPETYNFVYGVPNKVYYQAYSNDQRITTLDLTSSSSQQISLKSVKSNSNEVLTLQSNISTINLGRGYFEFSPSSDNEYFLSNTKNGSIVNYGLNVSSQVDIDEWEINFSVTKKVLGNDESLEIRLFTNDKMLPSDIYLLGVYNKERPMVLEQMSFKPNSSYLVQIDSSNFYQFNGGVLRVQLLRILRPLIWYERFNAYALGRQPSYYTTPQSTTPMMTPSYNTSFASMIMGNTTNTQGQEKTSNRTALPDPYFYYFTIPKGELLIFKKPSETLRVTVTTDYDTYQPGERVNFQVNVQEPNAYISTIATDESVTLQLSPRQLPPSLPAMVLLEDEIYFKDYEWMNNDQYVDQLYSTSSTGSDLKLDLLLGVQGWRLGFFYPQVIQQWNNAAQNMSQQDLYLLDKIFGYKFGSNPYIPYYSYYEAKNVNSFARGGSGGAAFSADTASGSSMSPSPSPAPQTGSPAPSASGQPAGPSQMSLTQKEQVLWSLIKRLRTCDFNQNTRYFANQDNFSLLFAGDRFDFTDTLYYSSGNYSATGVLKDYFVMSDLITQFRISANAYDYMGRLGYGSVLVSNKKQFYLSFTLPQILVQGDRLQIPVNIFYYPNQNSTSASNYLLARLSIEELTESLGASLSNENELLQVNAGQGTNSTLNIEGLNITTSSGPQPSVQLRASANNSLFNDAIMKTVTIVSPGVLQVQQQGGVINDLNPVVFNFTVPSSAVPGTFKFTAEIFPQNYQELFDAIKNIIEQPIQCGFCVMGNLFVESLALQYTANEQSAPASTLTSQVTNDYQTLLNNQNADGSFGVSQGSSDIVDTAQVALSLAQAENSLGYSQSKALQNSANYILSKRDSTGSFTKVHPAIANTKPQYIIDAFLLWVLTEIGYTGADLSTTLTQLQQIADQQTQSLGNTNAFFLALLSATYSNLNQTTQAVALADYLASIQTKDGSVQSQTNFFSTQSYDYVEATAMSAIAWEKANFTLYANNIQLAISYLTRNTYIGYYYYPTIRTVLSLKAILSYIQLLQPSFQSGNGTVALTFNGSMMGTVPFTSQAKKINPLYYSGVGSALNTIVLDTSSIENQLTAGQTYIASIQVLSFTPDNQSTPLNISNSTLNGTATNNFTLFYRMALAYDDTQPPKSPNNSALALTVEKVIQNGIGNTTSAQGEIGNVANYNVTLVNTNQNQSIGMIIVVFRPPSCYQLNFGVFEQLKANGIISLYEFKNSNSEAWMYISGLQPGQTLSFNIDLVQVYQGICQERPQEAFQYYNPQQVLYSY